jgi:hypothetical protein
MKQMEFWLLKLTLPSKTWTNKSRSVASIGCPQFGFSESTTENAMDKVNSRLIFIFTALFWPFKKILFPNFYFSGHLQCGRRGPAEWHTGVHGSSQGQVLPYWRAKCSKAKVIRPRAWKDRKPGINYKFGKKQNFWSIV